jgi:hypothetical protein
VLGQPELLALVNAGAAGKRESEQRGGAGPAQAERRVGLLVVPADAIGRLAGTGQAEK